MTINTVSSKTLKAILKCLATTPEKLTPEDAATGLRAIINGEANDAQLAGFITALQLRGMGMRPDMLAALAAETQRHALVPKLEPSQTEMVVDIVGTGGDGWNTFNISTTSSLVAAAAGLQVAKHGSRSSSSNCGSADLLESLGCDLNAIGPDNVAELLRRHRFCFLFSSTFHPSMRYLAHTRRELGFPTPFNVLGPLINPVQPDRAVVGVHSQPLGPVMAEALRSLGRRNYAVVCGDENLDEISIAGSTQVWHIDDSGHIDHYTIHPDNFGVPTHPLSAAAGSTLEENQATLQRLLNNTLEPSDVAVRDFVLVNTGFLLFVSGMARTMKQGAEIARLTLESGKVKDLFDSFARSTREFNTATG
ncbi:anthranilate phosphoribosyltransferase [Coemansia sp. RSA 2711]|nr:anthranilate phosphoribosyltransferase [Coemansia sp. RSA 2711]KAJ2738736.1 anthranilate phosphoribosyltransferase [Coemansia sp. Cherry 401B]